jgi:hypothetical protein
LAPFATGFREGLAGLGYRSGYGLMERMAELSAWMSGDGLEAADLTRDVWEKFVSTHVFAGSVGCKRWRRAVSPLLEYLGRVAGMPVWGPPLGPCDPLEMLVDSYERFLRNDRGMSRSARNYVEVARRFLCFVSAGAQLDVGALTAGVVIEFVMVESQRLKVASAKATATRLRSLLRFLHLKGLTTVSLAGAVPSVAGWRLASLPKGLAASEVARLLSSCDRRRSVGRRDLAILVVLARLGLRAGEVARLQLGDMTGDPATCWCVGRDLASTGCRFQSMSARLSPAGFSGDGHAVLTGRCSCGCVPLSMDFPPRGSRRWSGTPATVPAWLA